ncbi:MAG: cytochrome c nitrite reductase small subunit [Verrucomicrobiales bacterium]
MRKRVAQGIVLGAALGTAVGIAGYTFIYAKGASYLTNNPQACANCHVMQSHFDAWLKSTHRSVAVCNDCHAPHDLLGKYIVKADNGFWHSLKFTTGDFPDNMSMREMNKRVTEKACLSCHQQIVDAIAPHADSKGEVTSCIRCHSGVGHPRN